MNEKARSWNHNVIFDGEDIGIFESELTLLENFKKKGIDIPHLCCSGKCGCCKMLLISGTISSPNQGVLTMDEVQDNVILACCSYIQADIEVEIY